MLKLNISRQSRIYEFFSFAKKRIQDAQLPQVASSLTLTTILSIVPALAVILAAFSAFPMFEPYRENFEQLVLRSMLPTEYSEQIIGYIKKFRITGNQSHRIWFNRFGCNRHHVYI